jgi:tetratricopeptide (TPR) repeat protein
MRTRTNGIPQAYELAIQFNPSNTDALAAYAQFLMTHRRTDEADGFFRRALDHDRQLLSRYVAYAEYLAITEQMDRARELGEEIRTRFPNDRGYRALARLYETIGELDVGIAWGLRALRENPAHPDAPGQIAELYARIGDFDKAAEYEPVAGVGQLWLRREYARLAEEAGLLSIDYPDEPRLREYYAFALNALNDSRSAISVLENARMVVQPGAEYMTPDLDEALTIYIDALQAVGGREAEARALAEKKNSIGLDASLASSWWVLSHRSCTLLQLGERAEALDTLDNIKASRGLAWTPVLRDSLCFRRVAEEPRYQEVLSYLEMRQAELRARLPATLLEYAVADVRPVPP